MREDCDNINTVVYVYPFDMKYVYSLLVLKKYECKLDGNSIIFDDMRIDYDDMYMVKITVKNEVTIRHMKFLDDFKSGIRRGDRIKVIMNLISLMIVIVPMFFIRRIAGFCISSSDETFRLVLYLILVICTIYADINAYTKFFSFLKGRSKIKKYIKEKNREYDNQ
jgi:hypothetical protein